LSINREIDIVYDVKGTKEATRDIEKLNKAIDKTGDEAKKTSKEVDKLNKSTKKASVETKGLNDKMKDSAGAAKDSLKGFTEMNSLMGDLAGAAKLLSGVALFDLGKQIFDMSKKMYDLANNTGGAKRAIAGISKIASAEAKSLQGFATSIEKIMSATGKAVRYEQWKAIEDAKLKYQLAQVDMLTAYKIRKEFTVMQKITGQKFAQAEARKLASAQFISEIGPGGKPTGKTIKFYNQALVEEAAFQKKMLGLQQDAFNEAGRNLTGLENASFELWKAMKKLTGESYGPKAKKKVETFSSELLNAVLASEALATATIGIRDAFSDAREEQALYIRKAKEYGISVKELMALQADPQRRFIIGKEVVFDRPGGEFTGDRDLLQEMLDSMTQKPLSLDLIIEEMKALELKDVSVKDYLKFRQQVIMKQVSTALSELTSVGADAELVKTMAEPHEALLSRLLQENLQAITDPKLRKQMSDEIFEAYKVIQKEVARKMDIERKTGGDLSVDIVTGALSISALGSMSKRLGGPDLLQPIKTEEQVVRGLMKDLLPEDIGKGFLDFFGPSVSKGFDAGAAFLDQLTAKRAEFEAIKELQVDITQISKGLNIASGGMSAFASALGAAGIAGEKTRRVMAGVNAAMMGARAAEAYADGLYWLANPWYLGGPNPALSAASFAASAAYAGSAGLYGYVAATGAGGTSGGGGSSAGTTSAPPSRQEFDKGDEVGAMTVNIVQGGQALHTQQDTRNLVMSAFEETLAQRGSGARRRIRTALQ